MPPALFLILLFSASAAGQLAVDLPDSIRAKYVNHTSSCVQCSIGILGADQNVRPAELLIWDSKYGPAVLGGSTATRVRKYCRERGIEAWIIEGRAADTWPWIEWALRTGRGAAVTYKTSHFVTLVGISADGQQVAICDNKSPRRIQWIQRAAFLRDHEPYYRRSRSRHACAIILKAPPAPGNEPLYLRWWEP